jgi:D-sedoheptulose 7-phosphate isomerase
MIKQKIEIAVGDVVRAARILEFPESIIFIERAAAKISECYKRGGKILIAGNGGSLCDAMHFAEELTGQFRQKRAALPAIALADPAHMSCVANDMGYDEIFARGVEAFGKEGDLFIALTTSGNSPNLLKALSQAKAQGLGTIAFLGKTGGKLKGLVDLEWLITGFAFSDRIQEAHMAAIHIIIEMVEEHLFANTYAIR